MIRARRLLVTAAITGLFGIAFYYFWISSDTTEPVETVGARSLPATTAPASPGDHEFVSFFAVGDTGATTPQRRSVIAQMASHARRSRLQFIFLLGDNFYDDGVTSVHDRKWETEFEQPFANPKLDCPFFVALGNHDHRGSIAAQVEYSNVNSRWNMPAPYYRFEKRISDGVAVEFFVLDTEPIAQDLESATIQLEWFRDKLAASTADWKIVAAHHPILSGGHHGGGVTVAAALEPLFEEFKVDLYMSGHDHDLQLLDSEKGWLQLVSGAGSSLRTVHWTDATQFAEATGGFAWVMLTPRMMSIEIIGTAGHRYTHRIIKPPSCPQ